jgi:O-antigen ligase
MTVKTLDNAIYYALLLYALASSISIAAANIGISFALLFALIKYYKEPFPLSWEGRLLKAIIFFWFTMLISAIFAYTHPIAFNKLWAYIFRSLPFFLVTLFIDTKKKLFTALLVMAASAFIADMAGVWQAMRGAKALGFSSMAMILAGYLLQMIPVMVVVALEEKRLSRRARIFLGGVAVLSLVALTLNGTRGAWIAVLAVILLYTFFRISGRTRITILLLTALVFGTLVATVPAVHTRLLSVFDTADNSRVERLLLWEGSWRMFKDHPIVGVGVSNFEEIYNDKGYVSPLSKEKLGHAHNNFLQILAENGLLGFIGFCSMFGYFLFYLYQNGFKKNNPVAMGVFLATISLLIQGLTEFNFGDSAVIRMFWFLLGLAVASVKIGADTGEKDIT